MSNVENSQEIEGMQTYIGTKISDAKPMNRQDYNDFRGWELPADEDGSDEGYLVRYEDGYISWSPVTQFDEAYRLTSGMPFGLAIEAMKKGLKVARAGWNGNDMFVFLVAGSTFNVSRPPLLGIFAEGTEINYGSHMDIRKADGSIGTWSPSNSDSLADDWAIVE